MQKEAPSERPSWKAPEDVEIVTFSARDDGTAVRLGGNDYGRVFAGRMRFRDGSMSRVAIKTFLSPLSDGEAGDYGRAIEELKSAGVRIPKMGMVKLRTGTKIGTEELAHDEWAQISQLFGSVAKGSKIQGKSQGTLLSPKGRLEAVEELTKVANAGHYPVVDIFEPLADESKGIIPLDIDTLVNMERTMGRPTYTQLADSLLVSIETISSHLHAQSPERKALYDASLAAASPQIREALKRIIPQ